MTAKVRKRRRFQIQGIVHGVGFRPFVFNLAHRWKLGGWVLNDSFGVVIEAEGSADALDGFEEALRTRPPVLAQIVSLEVQEIPPRQETRFHIRESTRQARKFTLISPDISVCDDCRQELFDPADRRFRYPFINCTNCGPRYSIIRDIPYDRPNTTMASFPMCEDCRREYEDPHNRRFHAQPNACPRCGPRVWLVDARRQRVPGDPIEETIARLKEGHIVAIKGLGGFHLAVDATNQAAVERLRRRKHRYEKPLALMSDSLQKIAAFAHLNDAEREILTSPQRPICLLPKRHPNPIAPAVSPDNHYFGVMLPYTPLHYLLLREGDFLALVMTSGNISESPIIADNEAIFRQLGEVGDFFLLHDRDIYQRIDDSVVRLVDGRISYIRRARGFVPLPVMVKKELPSVLAVGGELKNTICLNKGRFFFLSQHLGDLKNLETLEFFEQSIVHLQKILEIHPRAIAHDLHPDYLSTRWAQEQSLELIGIQHHHAHIAACMAEKGLTGEVIGFSFDGTGYGPDGTVWGGEVLIASEMDYRRVAYFDRVALPGGDRAVYEPWRMAVAYSCESGLPLEAPRYFPDVRAEEARLVEIALERNLNAPLTSSCGRLFDAVAALVGLRHRVGYEGQAAMQLEASIRPEHRRDNRFYPFALREQTGGWVLDWRPLFAALFRDLKAGVDPGEVSWRFHFGLVKILLTLAHTIREQFRLQRVVLSGGCFQNKILTETLSRHLREAGFEVYYHTAVPPNDGGIALGQAYIASQRIKQGYQGHEISGRIS